MTSFRRPNLLTWIAWTLAALIGLPVIAEIGLRWWGHRPYQLRFRTPSPAGQANAPGSIFQADATLGWTYPAGQRHVVHAPQSGASVDFVQTHDDRGRREIPEPHNADRSLWIFGCSHTHGWALADDQPYPALLQRSLSGCRVTNFAVDGFSVLQMLLQYRQAKAKSARPDVVLVGHIDEQLERVCDTHKRRQRLALAPGPLPNGALLPYAKPGADGGFEVHYRSPTYRALPLANRLALVATVDRFRVRWHDAQLPQQRLLELVYRQFADEVTADGAVFVVAGLGCREGWDRDLRHRGVRTIDAGIGIDYSRLGDRVSPTDYRPSAQSHRKFAVNILDGLAEHGVLRDRVPPGGWQLEVGPPHQATVQIDGDSAQVKIDRLSPSESPLGLRRGRLLLQARRAYRYRVQAEADEPRDVEVMVAQSHKPWLTFYRRRFTLGTGASTLEDTFTAEDDELCAWFMLNLQGSGAGVKAWDFAWHETDAQAAPSPMPSGDAAPPRPLTATQPQPPAVTGAGAAPVQTSAGESWTLQVRDGGAAALENAAGDSCQVRIVSTGPTGAETVRVCSPTLRPGDANLRAIAFEVRTGQPQAIRAVLLGAEGQPLDEKRLASNSDWQTIELSVANAGERRFRVCLDVGAVAPATCEIRALGLRP